MIFGFSGITLFGMGNSPRCLHKSCSARRALSNGISFWCLTKNFENSKFPILDSGAVFTPMPPQNTPIFCSYFVQNWKLYRMKQNPGCGFGFKSLKTRKTDYFRCYFFELFNFPAQLAFWASGHSHIKWSSYSGVSNAKIPNRFGPEIKKLWFFEWVIIPKNSKLA